MGKKITLSIYFKEMNLKFKLKKYKEEVINAYKTKLKSFKKMRLPFIKRKIVDINSAKKVCIK